MPEQVNLVGRWVSQTVDFLIKVCVQNCVNISLVWLICSNKKICINQPTNQPTNYPLNEFETKQRMVRKIDFIHAHYHNNLQFRDKKKKESYKQI